MICTKCKQDKDEIDFNRKADKRQNVCRVCNSEYLKEHYALNKEYYKQKAVRARHKRRDVFRDLKDLPCMDCGIKYPHWIMQFDHVRGTKLGNLGSMAVSVSLKALLEEAEKCEVVCANCHADRTHSRRKIGGKYS